MQTTNFITLALVGVLTTACGGPQYTDPTLTEKTNTETKQSQTLVEPDKDSTEEATNIAGYISNAFDLTVDGERYSDSEDFYSRELDRLTENAVEAGYEGWSLNFDAQIGLVDLKYGLNVFIASPGGKGFAGQTTVNSDASFNVSIPENARKETYNIRALKRINLTLNPPEDSEDEKPVRWCYNFGAEINDVRVNGEPVVLTSFRTKLTKYACSVQGNGIAIPQRVGVNNTKETPNGEKEEGSEESN